MSDNQSDVALAWLAGVMDCYGQIGIKKMTMFAKFKSIYPDRLEAIAAVLGVNKAPKGPFDPSGDSKQPYYQLVLVGVELARLENVVTSRMRTTRRYLFGENRRRLQWMRRKRKLSGPFYKIASSDDL